MLKNLLVKATLKCISCKKAFPYEQLDEHELHCGKCNLCSDAKLSPALSLTQHHLNECLKVDVRCVTCLRLYKRGKFRAHKCEKALTLEEIEQRNQENF